MSSYDKLVKLACKPKAAPPKAKYLEPIIAATWSEDGAVHDVCKALTPRIREPNSVVVFKALIVLHTMIRNGATDNVLSYLSSTDVLKLRNVSSGNWEGYAAPENIQHYAIYLDSRIRAYRELKHDAIRVQAETNRDMRNSNSIEADTYRGRSFKSSPSSAGPTRSKTIMGRKLRVMTVEKGLLRETKAVHRMIDTLLECRFYLDNLEDELAITALRMLVKDLLILFQAGNEGVINVLEHYFEMSHIDAEEALAIYRHFCKQTERAVEFLGVAKKLQNLLSVPIPNLKHAPVSLAGALQEYLDDPNFEQNRIEYRANKEAARNGKKSENGIKIRPTDSANHSNKEAESSKAGQPASTSNPTSAAAAAAPTAASTKAANGQVVHDFFTSIEEQTVVPHSTSYNPFAQMQMMTGQPVMQVPQISAQPTGFIQPQPTAFQPMPSSNPFGLQVPQQQQSAPGHQPFSAFLPQATGVPQTPQPQIQPQPQLRPQVTGFLMPQATGVNPFRQSMLVPQSTGMALFGVSNALGNANGLQVQQQQQQMPFLQHEPTKTQFQGPFTSTGIAFSTTPSIASPFTSQAPSGAAGAGSLIARPSSTPLTSFGSKNTERSPPVAQPVKTHQTGTKNPFGPIPSAPPPVPKPPTLMELKMGLAYSMQQQQPQPAQMSQPQSAPAQPQQSASSGGFGFNSGALSAGATDVSSVASSFAFSKPQSSGSASQPTSSTGFSPVGPLNAQPTSATTASSNISDSLFSFSLSSQPTGMTSLSSAPSVSVSSPLKPQTTGFAGLKPFKPTSAFGASLLESLPPIPDASASTTPTGGSALNGITPASTDPSAVGTSSNLSGLGTTNTSNLSVPGLGTMGSFGSGSTLGQGLRPQMTGAGTANPFRASMMVPNATGVGGLNPASNFAGLSSSTFPNFSTPAGNAFPSSFSSTPNQSQQGASLI